jgi:hypothetical protein
MSQQEQHVIFIVNLVVSYVNIVAGTFSRFRDTPLKVDFGLLISKKIHLYSTDAVSTRNEKMRPR